MVRRFSAWLANIAGVVLASWLYPGLGNSDMGRRQAQLTAENRLTFTRRVQPILFNCCGSSACHGRSDAPRPVLKVPSQYGQLTPNMTEHNLEQVLSLVNLDRPQESPLLRWATQAHGRSSRPPLPNKLAPAYRVLEDWVYALAGQLPSQIAPGEISTSVPTRPAYSPSGQDAMLPEATANNVSRLVTPNAPQALPMRTGETGNPSLTGFRLPGPSASGHQAPAFGNATAGPSASARRADKPSRNIGFAGSVLPGTIVGSSTPTQALPMQAHAHTPALLPNTSGAPTSSAAVPSTVAPPVPAYVPVGIKPPAVADALKPQVPLGAAGRPSAISGNPQVAVPNSSFATSSGAASSASGLPRSTFPPMNSSPAKPVTPAPEPTDPFDPAVFNRALHPNYQHSKP